MMYHSKNRFYTPLTWLDVFPTKEVFDTLKTSNPLLDDNFYSLNQTAGLVLTSDEWDELYMILLRKYIYATTRYDDKHAFILALLRELMVPAKIYFKQKELFQSLINLTENDLIKVGRTLRNIVENPNMPSTDADEVPFSDLSSAQETFNQTRNRLDALVDQYRQVERNYQKQLYKAVDGLFKTIFAEDEMTVFPEE